MTRPQTNTKQLDNLLKQIYSVRDQDITCDECYDVIDRYVELLRLGKDADAVLPDVKAHLAQCDCCKDEFKALITILETNDKAD